MRTENAALIECTQHKITFFVAYGVSQAVSDVEKAYSGFKTIYDNLNEAISSIE